MDWKPVWHCQIIDYNTPLADLDHILQHVRLSSPIAGDKLRIRLDNRRNHGEMVIDRIAVRCASTTAERWAEVKVGGQPGVCLAPGQVLFTDPAELPVPLNGGLDVWMWIRQARGLSGLCQTWAAHTWQSAFSGWETTGDMGEDRITTAELIPYLYSDEYVTTGAIGMSQVDLLADEGVRTLVMFGDSITHMSYYSDALAARLAAESPGSAVIANAGIGGNRLCFDAVWSDLLGERSTLSGEAGYRRFEEDVFQDMKPDAVLMLEGINDVTHCYQYGYMDQVPTIEQYIRRCREVIDCAHRHHAGIYLGTILPENIFRREAWFPESEALRRGINRWIREQTFADGVMDLEAAIADPEVPDSMKAGLHLDGLHPNDAGGEAMAARVPLKAILSR